MASLNRRMLVYKSFSNLWLVTVWRAIFIFSVWSWKLSRTRSLSANATSAIDQIIDSIQVLNNRFFETVNNSDDACFYYPEANGQPVIFRGICDQNIPVVTGFDAGQVTFTLLLILWRREEVESFCTHISNIVKRSFNKIWLVGDI